MLTKNERKYLCEAKERLKLGMNSYLCFALMFVSTKGTRRLRGYIADQLGGHANLEDWQCKNGYNRTYLQTQKDRLDWIDWMLGEK